MPPTQSDVGIPLTDLLAYKAHYGITPGSFTRETRIDNPGITAILAENLVLSTYYSVATSINSADTESGFSNMATEIVE